ncbi:MAG TPA: ribonuclease J [Limnochordia bacterium]|nr:ribonuclease J [Limnochordia bacterium]
MPQTDAVSIIPLGGVGEIGKNMWVIEHGRDIVVLDAGVMFPTDDQPGVDLVIPDIAYLEANAERVRAIVLTHGHEDHIGALPYVLRRLNVPVYGTRLTLGLVKGKLEEQGLLRQTELREIAAGQRLKLGVFELQFIHVNHSIADVVAIAVHTPQGVILYATDFKFDYTPVDGRVTDLQELAELGRTGVTVLLSDSTNAERPGSTLSERKVGQTLLEEFHKAKGRILVTTFASNIHRIQQVLHAAADCGRRVTLVGRSMINNVSVASRLGYLDVPEDMLFEASELNSMTPDQVVILTTGSQGEPLSALTRMAMQEHRRVEIIPGDTVIISANPIPGNERSIGNTIDRLFRQGAKVLYHAFSGLHVSGHASQEELKLMLALTRPKHFVPIHGEYRMLIAHAALARQMGVADEDVLIANLGDRIEATRDKIALGGKVEAGPILVDGLGVGDVGNIVLRDRQQLSQDGILIAVVTIDKQHGRVLAGPDLVSRGFVYVRESESLFEEARKEARAALLKCEEQNVTEWGVIKNQVRDTLSRYFWERTKRRPVILPVVMEV